MRPGGSQRRGRTRVAVLLVGLAALIGGLPAPTVAAGPARPAVVAVRVIGRSLQGRPIVAWRVGDPHATVHAVAMAVLHGDEAAPRQILWALRDGRPVHGIDLWLLPTVNPDGLARRTRRNARGVDLNRNFPFRWAHLDGNVDSGPRASSEPETRALMRFFADVRPRYVVSFHQPLHGVDTSVPGSGPFAHRLARALDLPAKAMVCSGVCHGTFTGWFAHRFPGTAVTVEYGAHPGRHRLRVSAPRQLLRALGGSR